MSRYKFICFSKPNRRMLFLLIASHLLWSCAVFGLWSTGRLIETDSLWWSGIFIALQLYAAAQLLLPVLLLHPEERSRGFYLFWGLSLAVFIWLINQFSPSGTWQPLLVVVKSGLLLLVATFVGAAIARYVNHLWELLPICLVMTLADFTSWLYGPTAGFTMQIKDHYLAPAGKPPLVDMILVKLAFPGFADLAPVFGIADWIMVVFFAVVAGRYEINDNLIGPRGETLARQGRIGFYLPVSVVALIGAIVLAQATGLFIPALPVIALIMLLWYALHYLMSRCFAD
ncbi:MAG: hypothetical protein ACSLFC_10315 [Desulfuromonadales bacterium]